VQSPEIAVVTKKYHVYGLGNALVDTEIQVTDQDLHRLGIDKGLMTLVDEDRQHFLIHNLQDHLTLSKRACGGSAANTIISLTQFGGRGYLACKVADDDNGRFYLQDLIDSGVGHSTQQHLEAGITGKCLVMVTPDAERTMNSFLGIGEQLAPEDIDAEAVADSEYIYIEGYLVTSETGRAAVIKAREIARNSGTKVALSLSDPGIVAHFKSDLRQMIGSTVDLLFCNKQEALSWCDTDDFDHAVAEMQKTAKQFCITLGAEGALVFDGFRLHRAQGQPVTAVDTNGAGDMFAGAYFYAITQGQGCLEAATLANRAASAVVGQYGPRLHSAEYHGLVFAQ
jgi:sugar/nucleoside kinase (ribokinase family)